MPELYIGLMSGTSVDGIDAALVAFTDDRVQLTAFEYTPYSKEIKQQIQRLSTANALISLKDYGELDATLGLLFAKTTHDLLAKARLNSSEIVAIGSHGHTVYHSPFPPAAFSLQIGDPNIIAEKTAITTVADFRRRDIAAGGQGAPLVPGFHAAVFSDPDEHRCVVNIGGIANITVLAAGKNPNIMGFDTGMGNTLLDSWIQKHQNLDYDPSGTWAKSGKINHSLVSLLKEDCYFQASPPKSTGKEYFSLNWLAQKCQLETYPPEDVQASLCYLTAITICDAIKNAAPATERVLVCGGGVHNEYLLELIQENLGCPVESTAHHGIHPDHVEAMAFAWLAKQSLNSMAGNIKEVTGAVKSVILGGIYAGS